MLDISRKGNMSVYFESLEEENCIFEPYTGHFIRPLGDVYRHSAD